MLHVMNSSPEWLETYGRCLLQVELASTCVLAAELRDTTYLHWSKVTVRMSRRHAHRRIDRRRWGRAVRSAGRSGVVLTATPAEPDSGVTDGVALHLIDRHLCSMALYELDEAAAFARGNLDICNLPKPLKEGAQLVFRDVAGESTDEDSRVIRIRELIHRLGRTVVSHWRRAHRVHADRTGTRHSHSRHRCAALVLGSSSRDAHRTIAAIDALHLAQRALLIPFIGEANEAIAAGKAADWV